MLRLKTVPKVDQILEFPEHWQFSAEKLQENHPKKINSKIYLKVDSFIVLSGRPRYMLVGAAAPARFGKCQKPSYIPQPQHTHTREVSWVRH